MSQTIQEALHWASLFLKEHGREEKVAEIILMDLLAVSRLEFLMRLPEELSVSDGTRFKELIQTHATTGVPVQHLTGKETFYDRTFNVTKDTLVPRQETEELVYYLLEKLAKRPELTDVVDVGTGTGILAITLALENDALNVTAVDISEAALEVATMNAKKLQADVAFCHSDFLQALKEENHQVDVIVSNPPYIPYSDLEKLQDTVKNFDPHLALFSEEDGLYSYRQIITQAKDVLRSRGLLAFEIGYNQARAVTALIKETFPHAVIETKQDMFGKDRMVFADVCV